MQHSGKAWWMERLRRTRFAIAGPAKPRDVIFLRRVKEQRRAAIAWALGTLGMAGLVCWMWPHESNGPPAAWCAVALLGSTLPGLVLMGWKIGRAWHAAHQDLADAQLHAALNEGDIRRVVRAVQRGRDPNALLVQLSRCSDIDSPHRVTVAKALVNVGADPHAQVLRSSVVPRQELSRLMGVDRPALMTPMHEAALFPELMAYYVSIGADVHLPLPGTGTVLEAWVHQAPLLTMSLNPRQDLARGLAALDVLLGQGLMLDVWVNGHVPRRLPGYDRLSRRRMPVVMACFGAGMGALVVGLLERGANPTQADEHGECLTDWVMACLAELPTEDKEEGTLRHAAEQVHAWCVAQALSHALPKAPKATRTRL